MSYVPPSGSSVDLVFSGQAPPLQTGENLVFAFEISGSIVTTTVQGILASGLVGVTGIGGFGTTGQAQQSSVGEGTAAMAIVSVEMTTGQGNQFIELIAVYRPPSATNLIIDLGGVYSAPSGSNVVIDLGDLTDAVFYNKFQFFINDTALF